MDARQNANDHDDDAPVGRVLSRREAVRLLAVSGAAVLVGCDRGAGAAGTDSAAAAGTAAASASSNGAIAASIPTCVVRPELTVGPYFVDKQLNRSDIRIEPSTGRAVEGVPLALAFNVTEVANGKCSPLAGAMVDVWHCDAHGVYSAVNDRMSGTDSSSQKFLRGYQVTDAKGAAAFTTIYPGWYRGRTVHIHFKIRTPATAALADQRDRTYEFTSQLFFDEALSDRIFAQAPYAGKGRRDTMNANDGIFRDSNGQLMLAVAPSGTGYRASFDIGLDLGDAATGKAERSDFTEGMGGPRGGAGGRRGPPPGGRPGGPPPGAPRG
jgi:protocatechuate 3,4-dioxygenase beta subunit